MQVNDLITQLYPKSQLARLGMKYSMHKFGNREYFCRRPDACPIVLFLQYALKYPPQPSIHEKGHRWGVGGGGRQSIVPTKCVV